MVVEKKTRLYKAYLLGYARVPANLEKWDAEEILAYLRGRDHEKAKKVIPEGMHSLYSYVRDLM